MKFLLAFTVGIAATVRFLRRNRKPPKRLIVTPSVEFAAQRCCEVIDEEDCETEDTMFEPLEEGTIQTRVVKGGRRGRFAAHVANTVRGRLGGCPKRTGANMLVVQRMVRDYMKELNVRESHMPMHAPRACLLVFLPNKHDIAAAQLMGSSAFADRADDMGKWGHSEAPWWSRLPIVGRFATATVRTDGFGFSEKV